MISELKDDEILDFLMTSDFEDDYSPTELKYLLVKWRYFYRVLHGSSERKSENFQSEIKNLKGEVEGLKIEKTKLQANLVNKQNIINGLKNRNLSFKERFTGKIITKEDEN